MNDWKPMRNLKLLLIAASLPILAGAATHRYIVELSTEPAALFASRSFGPHKESLSRPEVQAHRTAIRDEQDRAMAGIKELGGSLVSRTDTASNTVIVDLPEENAARLSSIPGVKDAHRPRRYRMALDQASVVHKFPQAYSQVGGPSNAGKGIRIAIIDSGIDITHPAFDDSSFQAPKGFPIADTDEDLSFYVNNKVIVARNYIKLLVPDPSLELTPDADRSASDEVGHGTIVASCAAGGTVVGDVATFKGAAPGAYLGNYKVIGTPGTNSDHADNEAAVLKAIDDAIHDGMDIINYSLASFPPLPTSQDSVARSLNNAVAAGLIVTAAAGDNGHGLAAGLTYTFNNAGGQNNTIPALVSSQGAMNVIQVGASSNQRAFGPSLTVGSSKYLVDPDDTIQRDDFGDTYVFRNTPIVDVATIDHSGQACSPLPSNSLKGAIAFISMDGFDPLSDTCDPDEKMANVMAGGAVAGIIYDNRPEDLYDITPFYQIYQYSNLIFYSEIPGGFITYSDGLALKAQLAGGQGSATLDYNPTMVPLSSDRVAFLSSRGPNADLEIKPDLVAVGEDLVTATETVNPCNEGPCLYDDSGVTYPVNGTSASAPLVAGAAAVLKSARPGLSALQYRSLIINSAAPISDVVNGGLARVMDAGAGLLDVNAALNAEATVVPASLSFGAGGGSSALTQRLTITNAGKTADTFTLSVTPRDPGFAPQLDLTSLQLAAGASATVNVTIPGGVLGAGEYEGAIHIQGNNTATDTHVVYWFGVLGGAPHILTDMGSYTSAAAGHFAQAGLVFRVSDTSGVVMTDILPQITVKHTATYDLNGDLADSDAKVSAPYKFDKFGPGVIAVDVTPSSGDSLTDVFTVYIGDPNNGGLSKDFYISNY
jgi:minor extracellular serine protease Vpr